jgi:hypothetical protein
MWKKGYGQGMGKGATSDKDADRDKCREQARPHVLACVQKALAGQRPNVPIALPEEKGADTLALDTPSTSRRSSIATTFAMCCLECRVCAKATSSTGFMRAACRDKAF